MFDVGFFLFAGKRMALEAMSLGKVTPLDHHYVLSLRCILYFQSIATSICVLNENIGLKCCFESVYFAPVSLLGLNLSQTVPESFSHFQ